MDATGVEKPSGEVAMEVEGWRVGAAETRSLPSSSGAAEPGGDRAVLQGGSGHVVAAVEMQRAQCGLEEK